MKKAIIIIPYYGNLPSNFSTFIQTCEYNTKISWLLVTDLIEDEALPNNVKVLNWSFEKIVHRVQGIVDKQICLKNPYKLCDYKPLYGKVFADYIKKFDYWGYSDMDVVYGDLSSYLNTPMAKGVDKIGNWGHLTLFRNDEEVNNRYLLDVVESGQRTNPFSEMIATDETVHFDETNGINKIYSEYGFSTYTKNDLVNDIFFENIDLLSNDPRFFKLAGVFIWNEGKAQYYYLSNGKLNYQEFGYFHFQKRHFQTFLKQKCDKFYVCTDGYHVLHDINEKSVDNAIKANHSSFGVRVGYLLHNYFRTDLFTSRKIGNIYLPIKYIAWRVFKEKNFII